jgi:hypothetical protein
MVAPMHASTHTIVKAPRMQADLMRQVRRTSLLGKSALNESTEQIGSSFCVCASCGRNSVRPLAGALGTLGNALATVQELIRVE